jgi:Domain of unknown function (DUF4166)/Saccharopine dehydrogenase NADP binding domain
MISLRVLILGGYGTFGGRLAQLLADEPRLTLLIAGRARDKAEAFCTRLRATAQLPALAFDRDGDVERALAAVKPDLVVDASGPFQNYAGDLYGWCAPATSTQEQGRGSFDRLMCERFGPFAFGIALLRETDRLRLVIRRWSVLGIPLPRALAPFGSAHESAEDGRFHFHVEIRLPLIGLIVGYHGGLATPAA